MFTRVCIIRRKEPKRPRLTGIGYSSFFNHPGANSVLEPHCYRLSKNTFSSHMNSSLCFCSFMRSCVYSFVHLLVLHLSKSAEQLYIMMKILVCFLNGTNVKYDPKKTPVTPFKLFKPCTTWAFKINYLYPFFLTTLVKQKTQFGQ